MKSVWKFKLTPIGIDTASDVADLVSRAFSKTFQVNNIRYTSKEKEGGDSEAQESNQQPPQFMAGMFRLMGLDPSKLGALALNGLVFIAKMVRNSLQVIITFTVKTIWGWYMIVKYVMNRMNDEACTKSGTCQYFQSPPLPMPQIYHEQEEV